MARTAEQARKTNSDRLASLASLTVSIEELAMLSWPNISQMTNTLTVRLRDTTKSSNRHIFQFISDIFIE